MNIKILKLSHQGGKITDTIELTGSKSESNRALILSALSKGIIQIQNLSNADDTVTLNSILKSIQESGSNLTVDVGPAGTAMRFLTAYLSFVPGIFLLTGSERMKQRPIGILVNALRNIGASINYTEDDGYPPLNIDGGAKQTYDQLAIRGDVSSQYLSALLLIAPFLPLGLTLNITGDLTSRPYVTMTLQMLAEAGVQHTWDGDSIHISHQTVKKTVLHVEPDWSAASYWYAVIALSPIGSSLFLPGLKTNSLQGDSAIVDIMTNFGVVSTFENNGVKIEKSNNQGKQQTLFNFKECPDLAQTVIACCAALGYNATFTGLETLKIKETDRIKALQNELAKFTVTLTEEDELYYLNTDDRTTPGSVQIKTYEDHRMAMAFAPLAIHFNELVIEDPEVVGKSYPAFWTHLEQIGFITSN